MNLFKKLGFFTAFILPALVIIGFYLGGGWNWLTIAFVFLGITSIDYLVGLEIKNVETEKAKVVGE
ncbi:MAG: alkane 1-monooxygenase, partial [Flammeovirgaceae bacterium]